MKLTGKDQNAWGKPIPVPLCPPQIPRGLTWDQIRVSELAGQRLTA
jgi:hypothetical protein